MARKPSVRTIEERNELVLQWLPLVMRVANDFAKQHIGQMKGLCLTHDDLISLGNEALLRACETWNENDKRATLKTYLYKSIYFWLKRAIYQHELIPIPQYIRVDMKLTEIGHEPTTPQSYRDAGLRAIKNRSRVKVLDTPEKSRANRWELFEWIKKRIDVLDERERVIIVLWSGVGREKAWTYKEIGDYLGMTRQAVWKIKERSLVKLREAMKEEL